MAAETVINEDGSLVYLYRNWVQIFGPGLPYELFEQLRTNVPWEQQEFVMWGKQVKEPRRTFVFGQSGLMHRYTRIARPLVDWDRPLSENGCSDSPHGGRSSLAGCSDLPGISTVRRMAESLGQIAGQPFNAVLLNYYTNGEDYISPHSDKETSPRYPAVGTISLGGTRTFQFIHQKDGKRKFQFDIRNGDALIMTGRTQEFWNHGIPKVSAKENSLRQTQGEIAGYPRISITLRYIEA